MKIGRDGAAEGERGTAAGKVRHVLSRRCTEPCTNRPAFPRDQCSWHLGSLRTACATGGAFLRVSTGLPTPTSAEYKNQINCSGMGRSRSRPDYRRCSLSVCQQRVLAAFPLTRTRGFVYVSHPLVTCLGITSQPLSPSSALSSTISFPSPASRLADHGYALPHFCDPVASAPLPLPASPEHHIPCVLAVRRCPRSTYCFHPPATAMVF